MKKCAVLYTDNNDGKQYWSFSSGCNGESYLLKERTSTYPTRYEAKEFYGKDRISQARARINKDKKTPFGWACNRSAEIIEYDAESH